jgi:hypothetical protein
MSILNASDIPAGLINRSSDERTTRPRPDAQAGLINSLPDKGTTADTTSGTGLINGSPQTEE